MVHSEWQKQTLFVISYIHAKSPYASAQSERGVPLLCSCPDSLALIDPSYNSQCSNYQLGGPQAAKSTTTTSEHATPRAQSPWWAIRWRCFVLHNFVMYTQSDDDDWLVTWPSSTHEHTTTPVLSPSSWILEPSVHLHTFTIGWCDHECTIPNFSFYGHPIGWISEHTFTALI
jgi:hypothetical protein